VSVAQYSKEAQSLSEAQGIAQKKSYIGFDDFLQRPRGPHVSAVSVTLDSPLSSVHVVVTRTMLCSSAEHSVADVAWKSKQRRSAPMVKHPAAATHVRMKPPARAVSFAEIAAMPIFVTRRAGTRS
jgi:hypothetical protein